MSKKVIKVNPRLTLLGGILGVSIIIFAVIYITTAILLYTISPLKPLSLFSIGSTWFIIPSFLNNGYTFGYQYLSELGIGPSAAIYNYGLIITGILAIPVFLILYRYVKRSIITKIATISGVACCIFLSGLGVFPMYIWNIHFFCAESFFAFGGLAIILFSYAMYSGKFFSRAISWFGVAVIVGDIIGETYCVLANSPVGEYSAPFLFMIWIFVVGIQMLLKRNVTEI